MPHNLDTECRVILQHFAKFLQRWFRTVLQHRLAGIELEAIEVYLAILAQRLGNRAFATDIHEGVVQRFLFHHM